MDVDAFVATHSGEWQRLDQLLRRRRLSGTESDELIALYQRTATHLSLLQTRSPDPVLVARLSTLLARARSAVTGSSSPAWKDLLRFAQVTFPVAAYRAWRWWAGVAAASTGLSFALMAFIATHPRARAELLPPGQGRRLVEHDFASYYSDGAAGSFGLEVWTNNALVAAGTLLTGIAILPALFILLSNAVNLGLTGGYMIGYGHTGEFFGLISPHGILELTAVYLAAGAGLRLGWTWIAPGGRPRAQALAEETRAAITIALGLIGVLAVSGVLEAFVTPSSLPTWARVGIGLVAEAIFLAYVVRYGGRAARAGETGDLRLGRREDTVAVA